MSGHLELGIILKKVNQNNMNLTANDLWPCHVTSKCVTMRRLPKCTYDPSLVVNDANLFKQEQLEKSLTKITNNLT